MKLSKRLMCIRYFQTGLQLHKPTRKIFQANGKNKINKKRERRPLKEKSCGDDDDKEKDEK